MAYNVVATARGSNSSKRELQIQIKYMLNLFNHITPIYLLYLFYGSVFLFLGVSIVAKDMKGSDLQLADSLWLLGMFGFLHGAHEWLELGPLIEGEHMLLREIILVKAAASTLVLLSFVFLLLFGLSLLRVLEDKRIPSVRTVISVLLGFWFLYLWYYEIRAHGFRIDMQLLRQADIASRYTFGFMGGLAAAYGLIAYSRELAPLSRPVSRHLSSAGIGMVFYGFFTGLIPSGTIIPLVKAPVEVFRGGSAFIVTYFIIKALNIFDIETRKKFEQHMRGIVQTEKLTSLGQLAAGVAHEINNPLTNASLAIERLRHRMKDSGPEQAVMEKLEAVERNIDKASAIAQELLQFSRQKETEFIPCDLGRVVNSALTLLNYKLGDILVQHSVDTAAEVMGDPVKLEQVFINILSNASEAMPGDGTITVVTSLRGDRVQVRITDTGVGILPEHLPRVYDPFFTTKAVGIGTGLGLSISYGIIRQHHGGIHIASEVGKGTTVTIRIPTKERYAELYEKNSGRR